MAQSNKLANQYQCKSCTAFWWQNMCCNSFSSPKPLWVTKSFRNKNHTWSYNCVAFDANKPLPRNLSFRLICQSLWSKMDPLSSFSRTGSAMARKATKCWKIVCVLCVCCWCRYLRLFHSHWFWSHVRNQWSCELSSIIQSKSKKSFFLPTYFDNHPCWSPSSPTANVANAVSE